LVVTIEDGPVEAGDQQISTPPSPRNRQQQQQLLQLFSKTGASRNRR
jgi:hypothetical protein